MKKIKIAAILALVTLVSACTEAIPPGHKGKILTRHGYSDDVLEPGRAVIYGWDRLILLDTSTSLKNQHLTVKMKDKQDLTFDVSFRTRISGTDKVINSMFNDIVIEGDLLTLDKVYSIYGRDTVARVSRSVLGKYDVESVPSNFDQINSELHSELVKALANSPLEVSNVTLGNLVYPDVVTKAIEQQAERKLQIETENNSQAVELVKRTNAMALAEADREIELVKARTIRDQNRILSEGIDDKLLSYRALEVQERMSENKSAVFVPYEAMTSPGLQNRIYK